MDVEVVKSDFAELSVRSGSEEGSLLPEKQNGMVHQGNGIGGPIKFGSHGMDELDIKEGNSAPGANFPKDAVEEWPVDEWSAIHSFYFVKHRLYEDPKLKVRLDLVEKDIRKKNQDRMQIVEQIRAIKASRALLFDQLKPLNDENKQFWEIVDEKKKEMEPLQHALGKLRTPNSASREKGVGLCSTEAELNKRIKDLQYYIEHNSITLAEEKQILRDMKQLEGTREKVIANDAVRAKIEDSMGEEKAIEHQVKHMGGGLEEVRKEHQVVKDKRKRLYDDKDAMDKEITALEEKLNVATELRDKAYGNSRGLGKQRDEGNTCFNQYRRLLHNAQHLAAKKDIKALEEIRDIEVEKFMSLWNTNKAFRDDYESRILGSLDTRQLSRDGRMRNPDEKPLLLPKAPTPSEVETVTKTHVKRPKEDSISTPQQDPAVVDKVQKEAKIDFEDKGGDMGAEKLQKDLQSKQNKVDEAKLKEMRREEEIAKAKQALERKKKLAEKAAAKAAIKAQKEAEKKLKEREKKLKKKAASSIRAPEPDEDPTEADAEVPESEKVGETVEVPISVPSKNKDRKENAIRHKNRKKGPDSISRVILKRKKSTNYWVWAAAPAAALSVLMLSVIGYNYFF